MSPARTRARFPDVTGLSYADAVKETDRRRFRQVLGSPRRRRRGSEGQGAQHQSAGESDPTDHQRDHPCSSAPAPSPAACPGVVGQTSDVATKTSTPSGSRPSLTAPVDSSAPAGRCWGSIAGRHGLAVGHPDHAEGLQGQPVRDAQPHRPVLGRCRAEPAGARLDRRAGRRPDVPNSGQRTNAVVTQNPAPAPG